MINSDGQILLFLGMNVLLLAIVTEMAARRGWLPQWFSRKLLHIGAVGSCALAPLWLQDLTALRWMVVVVEPVLICLVATGRLFVEANGRRSWGIALFPLAYLGLLFFTESRFLIVVPMAILALSDAAAAIVGQLFARRFFQLTGDRKSLTGSGAFMLTTIAVIGASQFVFPELWFSSYPLYHFRVNPHNFWFWNEIILAALLLAGLEMLGSKGFDNLLVPWGAVLLLIHLWRPIPFYDHYPLGVIALWMAVVVAFLFARFTIRRQVLTADGAVTAACLGLWVLFFSSSILSLWPLLLFFITSILLGRLSKRRAVTSDAKHGQARDYRQVICNGGIYAVVVALSQSASFLRGGDIPLFIALTIAAQASLAISTADTWASEIGIYFRGKTYDIWRWRPTPVGLSGGVSWAGTLGGLAGSATLAGLGFGPFGTYLPLFLMVVAAGFAGMLLDSLLGATLQGRYRNEETGAATDIATPVLQSGYRWMSNDGVNLLSNILITVAVAVCVYFFKITPS